MLGALLIGLAVLIERFNAGPVEGRTLLSVLAEGSIGTGWMYYVVQFATVLLLALAANTSYGGLPVLAARLAADGALPHVFGLRGDRQVYRASIVVLTVLVGALLIGSGGEVTVLVHCSRSACSSASRCVRPGCCATGGSSAARDGSSGRR